MSSSETSIFQLPPGLKMAVFIGLSGISLILGGMISFSIAAALLHIPFSGLQSALLLPQNASIAQFANALASIIAFGLPGIVVAFFSKNTLVSELGFARIKNFNQIGLVVLIAITGLFLSGALGDLTEKIPIPIALRNWATQMEGQYKKALYAMTQMKSVLDLLFAIIAVAVVPAIVEELFFRGYLIQGLSQIFKNGIIPLMISSLLFGLAHMSNPEVQKFGWSIMLSYYVIFALFMGCITFLDEGLELAIGIHFANNMISGLLVSTRDSVLKPYSILETKNENPYLELICWFFMAGLTFLVFVKKYKWNNFNLLIK